MAVSFKFSKLAASLVMERLILNSAMETINRN